MLLCAFSHTVRKIDDREPVFNNHVHVYTYMYMYNSAPCCTRPWHSRPRLSQGYVGAEKKSLPYLPSSSLKSMTCLASLGLSQLGIRVHRKRDEAWSQKIGQFRASNVATWDASHSARNRGWSFQVPPVCFAWKSSGTHSCEALSLSKDLIGAGLRQSLCGCPAWCEDSVDVLNLESKYMESPWTSVEHLVPFTPAFWELPC